MKNLLKIILFVFMLMCSLSLKAQPQPKRDVSKDRKEQTVKKQKHQLQPIFKESTESPKKKNKKVSQKRLSINKRRKVNRNGKKRGKIIKYATYISVNYKNISFNEEKSTQLVKVETDGKTWHCSHVPSWCSVINYPSGSFLLIADENPSSASRSDWISVVSDGKIQQIYVTQSGRPNISAKFISAGLIHNYFMISKGKYLLINSRIRIKNAKSQKLAVVVFFETTDGKPIKASSSYFDYALNGTGELCNIYEISPTSNSSISYDVRLGIPNDAFLLPSKKNKLRCKLMLYNFSTSSYVEGVNYTLVFKAKGHVGKVKTKPW